MVLILALPASAQTVYRCIDEKGSIVLSDTVCAGDPQVVSRQGRTVYAPRPAPPVVPSAGVQPGRTKVPAAAAHVRAKAKS
ncbi:DUF4124 domain-containing protein [Rhodoferax sediminis]|nr:DUF4124 domain-containing protein [Rhodoferax sediminis]